jgi:hypothetical protein
MEAMMAEPFTDRDKLKAVQRELAMRRSVYPKWVASKRMKADQANDEIAVMLAIEQDYLIRINGSH